MAVTGRGGQRPHALSELPVAAVRTDAPTVGEAVLEALQSPQPPSTESILTACSMTLRRYRARSSLVIDDYHVIDAKPVDKALTFLLEHLPPRMHLVIATREDPQLPLARLRGGGQLSEVRAADLRFTPSEAAGFLNQAMGLNLSVDDVATLENRTEGWIAGLQLAALSLQGQADAASFIQAFSGSHHFVLDYLLEEVLQRQSETVQSFLLRTSILDQMCGALCDAVATGRHRFRAGNPGVSRACQPVPRSAGQRAALVPLSPSVRRFATPASPGQPAVWPHYTDEPASGTKTTVWRLKPFCMPRLPTMSSEPSVSSKETGYRCNTEAQAPRYSVAGVAANRPY